MKEFRPNEKQIQDTIINWLLLNQIYAWRNNTGMATYETKGKKRAVRYGKTGSADILGILPDGRFLAIEVKRPGNKPTELQQQFLDDIVDRGGVAFWADSIMTVIENLKKYVKN